MRGDGAHDEATVDAPSPYSQIRLPVAGSTATSPLPDWSTTVPPTTTGVVQFASFGRSSFHLFRPVRTSMPAVNDSLSFSLGTTSVSPTTIGDAASPRLFEALA